MVNWNGIDSDSWSVSEDGNTCTLTGSLTIPAGQTFSITGIENLVISQGGILTNNGAIWNRSIITCNGTIINNNNLHNIDATIINNGTVTNNKTIENENGGIITNNGSLTNDGTVDNGNGTITNNGTVTNNNTISIILGGITNNSGGTVTNNASLTNNGTIWNRSTIINNSGGTVDNFNIITNDGTIANLGRLSNYVTLTNNGVIINIGITERNPPTTNDVVLVPWNTADPDFQNLTNEEVANTLTGIINDTSGAVIAAAILALMAPTDAAYILTAFSIGANAGDILAAMVPDNTAKAVDILVAMNTSNAGDILAAMVPANTAEAADILVAMNTSNAVAIMNAIAATSTQTAASILKAMETTPTGSTAAAAILNDMTAKDAVKTELRMIGSALGDPYITPVYGPGYKLPDRNGVYRYISNKAPYANRFSIDADVVMLTKKQQFEAFRAILEHAKDSVHSLSGKLVLDGYFFRNYMLTNCGEKLLIDMEADTINGKPLRNIKTDKFTVSVGKAQAPPVYPYTEGQETVYSLTINTYHETYGNIEVVLHKYLNPQVRNGICMYTDKKLTHENSKGFIMHFQHYKQFSIHKLGSKKDIANFDKAKVPSKKKQVTEEFIHPGTGTQNLRFLQQ